MRAVLGENGSMAPVVTYHDWDLIATLQKMPLIERKKKKTPYQLNLIRDGSEESANKDDSI